MGMDYPTMRRRFFVRLAAKQGRWDARCEVCNDRLATELHHKRGRVGDDMIDPNYALGVCPRCHRKITTNPEWAYQNGYSAYRVNQPSP